MFFRNQKGVALLAVIFFLVVMAFVGVIFISLSSNSMTQSVSEVYSSRALYIAEGGLERAGRYLLRREDGTQTTYTCPSITGNGSFTNTPLGSGGQFTVTSSLSNIILPTTLYATTASGALTIPVASVANYASFGQIMIDRERINYTSTHTTTGGADTTCGIGPPPACFIGLTWQADGTTVSIHQGASPPTNATARVAQTQCLLTSAGSVPTSVYGTSQRVVSQADVLQAGWAVGSVGGGTTHPTMYGWDGTLWTNMTPGAPDAVGNLTSVSMVSAADGWSVSDTGQFLRWNGTTWTFVFTAPQRLNSVYMNSSTSSWAVGNAGGAGQQPLIYYWDGTTWSIANTTTAINGNPIIINKNLNSVYCATPSYCWAVGDFGGGGLRPIMLEWSGANWVDKNIGINDKLILNSVYCVTSSYCWAVGNFSNPNTFERPTTLLWDGVAQQWTVIDNSLTLNRKLNLYSVYCTALGDCWAVGDPGVAITEQPFIIHWDGNSWTRNNSSLGLAVTLRSVQCIKTDDCWASGDGGTLLHWNGVNWVQEAGTGANNLFGLSLIGPKRPNVAWGEVVQ